MVGDEMADAVKREVDEVNVVVRVVSVARAKGSIAQARKANTNVVMLVPQKRLQLQIQKVKAKRAIKVVKVRRSEVLARTKCGEVGLVVAPSSSLPGKGLSSLCSFHLDGRFCRGIFNR